MLDRREFVAELLKDRGDLLVVTGLGAPTYDVAAVSEHRLAMLTHTQLSNLIRDIGQDARAAIAKAIGGSQ